MNPNTSMVRRSRNQGGLMPQQPLYPYPASRYSAANESGGRGEFWQNLQFVLLKHWKASLAFAIFLELMFFLAAVLLHNTYESSATLEVDPPNLTTLDQATQASPPSEQNYLDTQIEILRSDRLALAVMNDLHLAQNPVFTQENWFQKKLQ
ncbi:MAG: Wzz/FepE/Etk N-terminal domain-containing protein, partial [Candidatus Acidiferrales bacterium]